VNVTANGGEIRSFGHAVFKFSLGPVIVEKVATVAEIEDEVILGVDILFSDESGPADLLLSDSTLIYKGHPLKLEVVGLKQNFCRVMAADTYIIPGMSEMMVDACIEDTPELILTSKLNVLVEPAVTPADDHDFLVAPCIISPADATVNQIRVMNPYPDQVKVHKNQLLGYAEEFDGDIGTMFEYEDTKCTDNLDPVRRIAMQENNCEIPSQQHPTPKEDLPSYLEPLIKNLQVQDEDNESAVAQLLSSYSDVFSKDEHDLGICNLTEHVIETGDARPIKQPPRKVPLAFADEDRKALKELMQQGSIRPSTSPWASPIVLVRKKNGKVRPCVDYRKLNAVTKKDAFPLPRIQDCLDTVEGAKLFSTLDITSAYNQVPVRKEDVPKTAFVTKYGLYEYTTMPFGLSNAPATFQRVMELALSGLQWVTCLIYLDDIIVFSKSVSEHVERLKSVFQRLREAGLKLKPEKCFLLQKQVTFLGHVVSEDGVKPDPSNIEKVVNWPTPKNVTQVRGILALGNYYRRFVKDFSKIVKPMTQLTEKGRPFTWSSECETAFQTLKQALISPSIMGFPRDGGQFILDTDACDISIGAVLSQVQEGVPRVISYGSRTLNKAERNYCVTDRELLAVKFFCDYYRQYLLGYSFLIRTDHQALRWLFSLKEPKNRIARWLECLSQYEFTIEHRPGKSHGNADGMSRCPDIQNCECKVDEPLSCGPCPKCLKRSQDMQSTLLFEEEQTTKRVLSTTLTPHLSGIKQKLCSYLYSVQIWVQILLLTICDTVSNKLSGYYRNRIGSWVGKPSMNFHKDDGRLWPKLYEIITPSCIQNLLKRPRQWYRKVTTRAKSSWSLPYDMKDLEKQQSNDPNINPIVTWLKQGVRPYGPEVHNSSPETRHYWNSWDSLKLENGLLYRTFVRKNGSGQYQQLIVPKECRSTVMHQMHNSLLSGHLGNKKTREKTLMKYYWYGVREDISQWIKGCDQCGQTKKPPKLPRAPLGEMQTGAPFDRLTTDFLGPFPETPRGNKHILVVTDTFTKWVEIFATTDQSAKTTARIILNEVIARYGCPYDLLSDQGRNYESSIFTELCKLLEIRKLRTSVANPQCNGQAERFNRTLLSMIKSYLWGQQTSWDENLGCLAGAYRMTPHESTTQTPNFLMMGREVRVPVEILAGSKTSDNKPVVEYTDYINNLRNHLQRAHEIARKHLSKKAERQKQDYDAKSTLYTYKSGDYVWYASEFRQLDIVPKLRVPYCGPFLVIKKINDLNYVLQLDAKGTQKLVHHNKLKPYLGSTTLKWAKTALKKI
jgi:transposase InsO family protein